MIGRALFTAALVLLALATVGRAEEISAKEQKARAKAAPVLADWAIACAAAGADTEARAALEGARELGLGDDEAAKVDAALDAAPERDEKSLSDARRSFAKKLTKAYDDLAGATDDAEREARFRLSALTWDPSKGRGRKTAQWIAAQDDAGGAARLWGRALAAAGEGDAAGTLTSAVADEATSGLFLIGSAERPLVAYLSLPKGWKAGRHYPVLVGVDGAGSNFEGYGRASTAARGSRDVIGLYPVTLSNTNALEAQKYPYYTAEILEKDGAGVLQRLAFDLAGVDAILATLRTHFGAEDQVFLTGFSGGGQFTYYKLLQEPQTVAGAVPCCGNFSGAGAQGSPGGGEGGGPPILVLTGENDPHREFTFGNKDSPGIEPQTDLAFQTFEKLGFTNTERRMVKSGHSPLHAQAWEFVDKVLGAR